MVNIPGNSDFIPPLPSNADKQSYAEWGESLISRTARFADNNRIAVVHLRPLLTIITSITGASGVISAFGHSVWGFVVLFFSIVATALSSSMNRSQPELFYAMDRKLQSRLRKELNYFTGNIEQYENISQEQACRHFAKTMTDIVDDQIQKWAEILSGQQYSSSPGS